jgi:hypothetical protein
VQLVHGKRATGPRADGGAIVIDYLFALVVPFALMWISGLGCGLALERLLGLRLSNALLLPLGMCVSIVLIYPGYAAGAGDGLAVALLVAVTLAGLVLARDGLRARLNPGWPGVAGLAAYIFYMLPVIAYGHWTWSGYDFVNDSGFEMLLAEHLKGFGTTLGSIPQSTAREFVKAYLGTGYPLGSQALLGTFSGLSSIEAPILFQGFISGLAAIGAVALATITGRVLSPRRAAFVAFVAIAANLTYQYALQGGIKEIALLATVCAAVALARAALGLGRPYAGAVLVAVAGASALATYNAVAVPYLGALVLFTLLGALLIEREWSPRRWLARWAGPLAAGVGLAALLAIPSLVTFGTFFGIAESGQGASGVGATQYGQLLRALPLSQISGVWLAGEYRLPISAEPAGTLTAIATVALLALLIPGVLWALHRREVGPLLLLGTMGLVLLIVFPRVSPYAQGKLLAIAGPAVVLVALAALGSVRGRAGALALVAGGALSLGVLASDLLAYSYDRVAPTGQMAAIEQAAAQFKGQGPVLWNEFEEYAKVFGRRARIYSPFEALTPEQVKLRQPTYFYGHAFDLDQETLAFVEGYANIVTRSSPAASRPPANYRLVYRNRYYLGWRRQPTPVVLRHLPEQQQYSATDTVTCKAMQGLTAGAPAGSSLVVAEMPALHWFEPLYSPERSYGWGLVPGQPGAIIANTPGHASGTVTIPTSGLYNVWVQGDFPRPVGVEIDHRKVGSVSGSNTPNQWLQAATVYVRAGAHFVRVVKAAGHRHFGPGEWGQGIIGAVALQRDPSVERLRNVALRDWRSLCGREADWVELVRP